MRLFCLATALGLLTGCSSLAATFGEKPYCPDGPVYCGTRVDASLLAAATDESAGVLRALWPIALIDLPFSAIADTLLLPYTLYQDAKADK